MSILIEPLYGLHVQAGIWAAALWHVQLCSEFLVPHRRLPPGKIPQLVYALCMQKHQVLEVVAEETKPLRSYEDLLTDAPSDGSQAEKLERIRMQQEAAEQLEAARQQVRARLFPQFCIEHCIAATQTALALAFVFKKLA